MHLPSLSRAHRGFSVSFPTDLLRQSIVLAGPTACGKTACSILLAERFNAEIVALDSMTIYREMDIGTAKPTAAERSRVPHHLIDLIDPDAEFSLPQFLTAAEAAVREILDRGRLPLFVGGTGLYLRGLLRGVFEGPSADWELRNRWEQEIQQNGADQLFERLRQVDPVTATRLHPNDHRRVIRALEVYELTKRPLSELQQHGPRPPEDHPRSVLWISPPRDVLHQRINVRVENMFESGLIEEVLRLMNRSKPISHTARQGLGYKEVIDWFEQRNPDQAIEPGSGESRITRGERTELITLIQTRTRQFAKRQHTWFRNLEECRAVEFNGSESSEEAAAILSREIEQTLTRE